MGKAKILVVDDEKLIRWSLRENLENEGYEVYVAASGEEALEIISEEIPDLILQDIKLPGISGMEILEQVKKLQEETLVIMMTAYGDIKMSVKAMKLGAYDFIEKPFDYDKLAVSIAKALETVSLKREVKVCRSEKQAQYNMGTIVGQTSIMKEVFTMAAQLARSEATTVLLQGESGTGKDVLAKAIHYQSQKTDAPFIDINCTSLPETLIESELFGHEKGAFTDAKSSKKGLFEIADGGSIFLDEIGDLPLGAQAKILKVIENKSFKRVGGTKEIVVDVRIIAATNKDLEKGIQEGQFRQDLYYRLKVFPIYLPPLRERKADIPLLIDHFFNFFKKEFIKNKTVKRFSKRAINLMMAYDWPGNVRELKNVIERAIILGNDESIEPKHLPLEIHQTVEAPILSADGAPTAEANEIFTLAEVEKRMIIRAMKKAKGKQVEAAKLLGLSRDTLRYRMKKYNMG